MLIVVDPGLTQGPSHHLNAFVRIAESALEVGVPVVAFTHASFDAEGMPEGIKFVKGFDFTPYDCSSPNTERAKGATAFFGGDAIRYTAKLVALLRGINAGPNDTMLIPSANAPDFAVVANLVERDFGIKLPRIHVVTPYDKPTMYLANVGVPLQQSVNRLKNKKVLEKSVFLHGENPRLGTQLKKELGADFTGLIFPFTPTETPQDIDDGRLHVGMFGAARIEKGFQTILTFVDLLAESGDADAAFKIDIYCAPPSRGYEAGVADTVYELKSRDYGFLNVSDAVLTREEYVAALNAVDAVYLPYNKERYAFRSSGVAMEAAFLGKLIIATKDTFPATLCFAPALQLGTSPREFANIFWRTAMMRDQLLARAASTKPIAPPTAGQFAKRLRLTGAAGV